MRLKATVAYIPGAVWSYVQRLFLRNDSVKTGALKAGVIHSTVPDA